MARQTQARERVEMTTPARDALLNELPLDISFSCSSFSSVFLPMLVIDECLGMSWPRIRPAAGVCPGASFAVKDFVVWILTYMSSPVMRA